jgi:hypothetical protein
MIRSPMSRYADYWGVWEAISPALYLKGERRDESLQP